MSAAKVSYTQSQKLMTFVLSMSLYGLATLISELIPSVQVGVVEFSVEFFLFIPLTIAMLFDPLSAALGAATGELVFSEIMLGQFGGIGELEKFLTVTIAVYIAGTLVKDPRDMKSIALVSLGCTALQLVMSAGVDICRVVFAVEEFEAVPGRGERPALLGNPVLHASHDVPRSASVRQDRAAARHEAPHCRERPRRSFCQARGDRRRVLRHRCRRGMLRGGRLLPHRVGG